MDLRHTRAEGGTPVVTWAGDRVTAEELREHLERMSPAQRERYQTLESKREYVEGLARYELLVREALERGLQEDPEVVAATRRALVNRLLRARLDEALPPATEAELADAYARHIEDYVRPEQVRLSHVFLAAPPQDPARVARAREKAGTLLAEARALPPRDFAAFGRLARAHSEEPRTQPLDGDLRYRSFDELARDFGDEVARAARALVPEGPGALSGVVETEAGLHVLRLTGHQPALNQSLEDVRAALSGRLAQDKRARAWAQLVSGLERRAGLAVDAAALARVHVPLEAPVRPANGPPPALLPAPLPSVQVTPP